MERLGTPASRGPSVGRDARVPRAGAVGGPGRRSAARPGWSSPAGRARRAPHRCRQGRLGRSARRRGLGRRSARGGDRLAPGVRVEPAPHPRAGPSTPGAGAGAGQALAGLRAAGRGPPDRCHPLRTPARPRARAARRRSRARGPAGRGRGVGLVARSGVRRLRLRAVRRGRDHASGGAAPDRRGGPRRGDAALGRCVRGRGADGGAHGRASAAGAVPRAAGVGALRLRPPSRRPSTMRRGPCGVARGAGRRPRPRPGEARSPGPRAGPGARLRAAVRLNRVTGVSVAGARRGAQRPALRRAGRRDATAALGLVGCRCRSHPGGGADRRGRDRQDPNRRRARGHRRRRRRPGRVGPLRRGLRRPCPLAVAHAAARADGCRGDRARSRGARPGGRPCGALPGARGPRVAAGGGQSGPPGGRGARRRAVGRRCQPRPARSCVANPTRRAAAARRHRAHRHGRRGGRIGVADPAGPL